MRVQVEIKRKYARLGYVSLDISTADGGPISDKELGDALIDFALLLLEPEPTHKEGMN